MKKIITTILMSVLAVFAFAEETKTADQVLLEGFNAITVADTTLTGKEFRLALRELRIAYLAENAAVAEAYATSMLTALEADPTIEKNDFIVVNYVITDDSILSALSIKVATAIGLQSQWLEIKGISYSTLKASNFVYDGVDIVPSVIYSGIITNKDYTTAKSYIDILFIPTGVKFITDSLLDMTNASVAYEDSKFWENVALKANNASVVKKIQDVQDIIYLRLTRDNKIQ